MSINIFGVVGEHVRASDIIPQLQAEKGDTIEVNIMSPGGSVVEGLAIYDTMRSLNKKIITRAMGQAASIASIIFMAGDEREVADNAEIMVHNAWTGIAGNKNELSEVIDRLDTIDQKLVNIYASRTNLNEDQVKDLLDKETFMSADEALEMGFATSKADSLALVAQYNQSNKQEMKEPVNMAEEEVQAGLLDKIIALFKSDVKAEDMPKEEEPEAMEEEKEPEAMEEKPEPEAMEEKPEDEKAEGEEELPEQEDDDAEKAELKARVDALEKELAEAKAKAEDEPKAVKEEAVSVAGLILDAMTDDKITMHEAKNLSAKDLSDVQAVLKDKEINATGRGKAETPNGETVISAYEQYQAISDPAERNAFFAKNKESIINQSKES